ncbi:MAG: CPBP family intramembrane metalloprotease, partial [Bacteroidota bacterium]|nr:CPBP family intramembrane metalloprotease [Bacteroidota bacterium]
YILPESLQPLLREFERLMQGMYAKLLVMNSPTELAAVWVVVALVPSVCEEAVFRGVAQSTFENGMRPGRAAAVTGLCFGLYHLYPTQLIPLTAIGIVLGVAVLRTGSIIPAVVGHLANNTLAVIGEYIHPTAGKETSLFADPGGATLTLSTAAGACLFALCMVLFLRGTRRFPPSPEKEN